MTIHILQVVFLNIWFDVLLSSMITYRPSNFLIGKVALVTGGTRGIGRGIALGLAEAGAKVYISGRSSGDFITDKSLGGTLQETVKEIESIGGVGIGVVCDHRKDEEVQALFDRIEKDCGRLDILVNNAFQIPLRPDGELDNDMLFRKFWELPGWFWDSIINVGVRSHYIATVYAIPLLKKAKELSPGKSPLIAHISSFGGVSYSFNTAYGIGKAAVDRMAKDMAIELDGTGISCVSIYPGLVRTERMATILSSGEWRQRTGLNTPDRFVESPRLTGRVIAQLYLDSKDQLKVLSGKICVVAEVAKQLGIRDLSGDIPPSIRSLRFLIPSLILNAFDKPPDGLEDFLVKYVPDILMPMSLMSGGPPKK